MILCITFTLHLKNDGKNGLNAYFSGSEAVSGGVFLWYFNGFQVSMPGPSLSRCERFLHDSGPVPAQATANEITAIKGARV